MDATDAKMLRDAINDELAKIGPPLGFQMVATYPQFGTEITFTLVCSPIVDGKVITQSAEDFKRLATSYGLRPTDLGRSFHYKGSKFTITGATPRRAKMPIDCEREDGKVFKFAPILVSNLLGKADHDSLMTKLRNEAAGRK
jgi:hypothetical protein